LVGRWLMTSRTLLVSSADRARREPWVRSRGLRSGPLAGRPDRGEHAVSLARPNAHRSYGAQWTPAPRRRCRRSRASAPVRCPRTISPPACTSALFQAGAARAAGHRRDGPHAQRRDTRRAHRQETQIARSRATSGPTPRIGSQLVHERAHCQVAPRNVFTKLHIRTRRELAIAVANSASQLPPVCCDSCRRRLQLDLVDQRRGVGQVGGTASLEALKSAQTSTSVARQTTSTTSATPISNPASTRDGRSALDRVGGAVSSGSRPHRVAGLGGTRPLPGRGRRRP
jgi:hypothetical protein